MGGTAPAMTTTEDDLYRIGTVAKLTGISVECLRAWERRYGLMPAGRTGTTRLYSRDQLNKLVKVKALIEKGHPISTLVELSMEQLDARLSTVSQFRLSRLPQIGLVGPNLLLLEQQSEDSDQAEICHRWVSIDDFATSRATERAQLDAVAVQVPSLSRDELERARNAAPDCRLIVVYQFATAQAIALAREQGALPLAWPVMWADLMRQCAQPLDSAVRIGKAAPRRYNDHELVALASKAMSLGDETPRHLVTLITNLNAFGDYATQCIIEQASDAELHERVREEASHARAVLERALAGFVERKGIAV
jgi:MerR family transcriptional regulator, light-induced transcriptional regulator